MIMTGYVPVIFSCCFMNCSSSLCLIYITWRRFCYHNSVTVIVNLSFLLRITDNSQFLQVTEACLLQEWWTYVCMGPSDPHPNWHLGMRGTQHRAVMWRVWKEGGTGFLYWGANCYEKATIPSAEVVPNRLWNCTILHVCIWMVNNNRSFFWADKI